MRPTLPARDYYAADVFDLEKERIFSRNWFCVGREEQIPAPGDYMTRDVVDENVLVVRDDAGGLRAFYNACRHRGTRLCEGEGSAGKAISCPYHAWTYALDGRLIATPNVPEVAGFDRARHGLNAVALEIWEGFVFVNLAAEPGPLDRQFCPWAGIDRYRIGRLRTAHRFAYDVAANWKIIHENYNECLHCPKVHPELVKVIPVYRRGTMVEPDGIWGNRLVEGATSFTRTGRSRLSPFPDLTEEEMGRYNGMTVFPNLILDCFPDNVLYTILWPGAPERTNVTCGLLVEASSLRQPDFDPADVVEFHDLVNRQDWGICERAQKGQRSRGYRQGVYPPQDEEVYAFDQLYLRERGRAPGPPAL
ncbi:MAG: aromatic ring-hydroxylating oxygenase subunit alpha [Candidatus Polarisedimenticolia bacterium]